MTDTVMDKWITIHQKVRTAHYTDALKVCKDVKTMTPQLQRFFDLHDTENKKMDVGSRDLFARALDIVCDLELHLTPADVQIMENRLAEMDDKHHFVDYEKTGAARWLLLGDEKRRERPIVMDSRYVWATIFAHLWVVSDSVSKTTYDNEAVLDQTIIDATFVCGEFTGQHQKTFCYILLTLNMLVAFLPTPLTGILTRFLEVLDSSYNGVFPEQFIHRNV